jgi:putative membrane protein
MTKDKKRTIHFFFGVYLKGILMGIADVIPGVSGGTIAFITGIYEELIFSLQSLNLSALKLLLRKGIIPFFKHINAKFLFALGLGIFTSLIFFVQIITWCVEHYPQLVWSLFFGLVLASSWVLMQSIELVNKRAIVLCAGFGSVAAWMISGQTPIYSDPSNGLIFLSGCIAICAMVLPGVSGSFMLLILGVYMPILNAIKTFDINILVYFCLGCIVGLLSFVHVLSWLLKHFKVETFSLLVGFLLGSLRLLWPWKANKEIHVSDKVIEFAINTTPEQYDLVSGHPSMVMWCLFCMILGACLVMVLYYTSEGVNNDAV